MRMLPSLKVMVWVAVLPLLTLAQAAAAPTITTQPLSQAVMAGQQVSLTVAATGTGTLSYQWYEGATGDTSVPVAGADSATSTVNAPGNAKHYWVRVSNIEGSTDSTSCLVLPWLSRDQPLGTNNLSGAAYANGRYVVIGHELSAVSTDGTSWTTAYAPAFTGGRAGGKVAYGEGLYVAGEGSMAQNIYTSSDGLSWTGRGSAQTNGIISRVLFDGSLFVAVGDNGDISISPDGIIWTNRLSGVSGAFKDLAIGNGVYVAVGSGVLTGLVMTSPDGIAWTARTPPTNQFFKAIAYGGGRFVALAAWQQNEIWSSTDGVTWTQQQIPTLPGSDPIPVNNATDIVYGGGVFVAAIGPHLLLSEDGATWSVTQSFFSAQTIWLNSLAYGNGRFLSAGEAGTILQSLSLDNVLAITNQSDSPVVVSGQTATLSVSASGSGLSYQWYVGASGDASQPITGATSASYTTPQLTQTSQFWVRVSSGPNSVDSSTIIVTVAVAPAVTGDPQDVDLETGTTATLSGTVTGIPTPTIQWYQGASGDTSNQVVGGTITSLGVTAGTTVQQFWFRATNLAGHVDSRAARVTPWYRRESAPTVYNARKFGSIYVAVGSNYINTSADGLIWTRCATISNSSVNDIEQGAGLYVAVGDHGFFTSPDLVTWTQRNIPPAPNYNGGKSIARGNNVFVVVGYGAYNTSADGITWTARTLPSGVTLNSVLFDGTRFVACGYDTTNNQNGDGIIFTSPDGIAWTEQAREIRHNAQGQRVSATLNRVAYVGGKYFAVGDAFLISDDAIAWTSITAMGDLLSSVGRIGDLFVVGLGEPSISRYYTSSDGFSWTARAAEGASFMTLLSTDNALVALGDDSFFFATTDGLQWTLVQGAPPSSYLGTLNTVAFGAGHYVAVGQLPGHVYVSSGGALWRPVASGITCQRVGTMAYGCAMFVAADSDVNGQLWTSLDGITWTQRAVSGTTNTFTKVMAAGNRLFAFAQGSEIASSTDGVNWGWIASGVGMRFSDVAYGNGNYVAVGDGIARSSDGVTWTKVLSSTPGNYFSLYGVAFGDGEFVAVGGGNPLGVILTSPDGQTWTPHTSPAGTSGLNDIVFADGRFVVAGPGGVLTSRNGITWQISSLASNVTALTVGNDSVVGVGYGAPLWQSESVLPNAPVICEQPWGYSSVPGQKVSFLVRASGTAPLSYQWKKGGVNLSNDGRISGATTATLTLTNVQASDAGSYTVVVSNSVGNATSDAATLRVRLPFTIATDFNGDGQPDILWRNITTGAVGVWLMNGTTITSYAPIDTLGTDWLIAGTGDFNGDGKTDILLRNTTTGAVGVWLMNGTTITSYVSIDALGMNWSISGTGDFNSDGKIDILWRNTTTGAVGVWLMNGAVITSYVPIDTLGLEWLIGGTTQASPTITTQPVSQAVTAGQSVTFTVTAAGLPPPAYQWRKNGVNLSNGGRITGATGTTLSISSVQAADAGTYTVVVSNAGGSVTSQAATLTLGSAAIDFNCDGKTDILWRNTDTGAVGVWLMNGTTITSYVPIDTVGLDWSIAGTGDFNGDGKTDILWSNTTTGAVGVWLMNGTTITSYVPIDTVGLDWSITGTGDFNGDGKTDILWRNTTTGAVGVWLMNGTTITSYVPIDTVGTDWSISGTGDFNGDGKIDILWRYTTTGAVGVWLMNGTIIISYVPIDTVPTVWQIKN